MVIPWGRPRGRGCAVTLSAAALRHNLQRVREVAPHCRITAAVKADGYGHGLLPVARALAAADALGVASIDEALQLREAGITTPITLLEGFFHADELPLLAPLQITPVLHRFGQIEQLERYSGRIAPLALWVKIDSGMHRLGFPATAAAAVWRRLRRCAAVRSVVGFMTHLATADRPDDPQLAAQLHTFASATEALPGARSVANSAALLQTPASHYQWVRPGLMLYGISPFVGGRAADHQLQPVMTLSSEVIAIHHLAAGEAIGYGGSYRTPQPMAVGIIAIGYGDGYPRHAANGTPVLIRGVIVPLIGRVSMDMIAVDLRALPTAQVGDRAILWGDPQLPIEAVAAGATTIPYELTCGITARVRRRWLNVTGVAS